jgi:Tfp pilus assembly protein FimT
LAQIGIGRGEAVAHRLAPVVIARNDEYRHCQAGQDINHESVLVQAPRYRQDRP